MQFSARSSELYTEFAAPGSTGTDTAYILDRWPVRYADTTIGRYHTLTAGDITLLSAADRHHLSRAAASLLRNYLEGAACVLVCGLGNAAVTADRLGTCTCSRLTLSGPLPDGRQMYTFCPGVPAVTGLPTDTLVRMIADCIKADRILAVDALCARSAATLSSVLQISDTGLTPGSGTDPAFSHDTEPMPPEISTRTMPCPVVTLGVPTVIRTTLPDGGSKRYLVTAGNTDRAVDCWSSVLASAILRAILSGK